VVDEAFFRYLEQIILLHLSSHAIGRALTTCISPDVLFHVKNVETTSDEQIMFEPPPPRGCTAISFIDQTIGRTNPNTVESKQQADPSDEGYQFLIFSE
jgi:hypothetical protein